MKQVKCELRRDLLETGPASAEKHEGIGRKCVRLSSKVWRRGNPCVWNGRGETVGKVLKEREL